MDQNIFQKLSDPDVICAKLLEAHGFSCNIGPCVLHDYIKKNKYTKNLHVTIRKNHFFRDYLNLPDREGCKPLDLAMELRLTPLVLTLVMRKISRDLFCQIELGADVSSTDNVIQFKEFLAEERSEDERRYGSLRFTLF